MAKSSDRFRWFDSSPEIIRLAVLMYVKYPLWFCHLWTAPALQGVI